MIRFIRKLFILIIVLFVMFYVLVKLIKVQNIFIETFYPKKYEAEVSKYAEKYDVDPNLIYAIIKAESNFNEKAVSRSNAMGLMQLMYDTAMEISKTLGIEIDKDKLLEPDTNINLGTKYISSLISRYGNVEVALSAYNAGSGNVDNWISNGVIQADGSDIENVPFKETNNYVRKILRDYEIYKRLQV